jgi:hypothetical protein
MAPPSVTKQKLSDGTTQWSVGGFVTTMRILAPGVIYATAASSGEQVFIPEVTEVMEAEIAAHGHIIIFVNLLEAARFGGDARESWGAWAKKQKQHASAHFLVRSKLVDMGISLIAMFSGADLRSYSNIEPFVAAMQRAAPNAVMPKLQKVA